MSGITKFRDMRPGDYFLEPYGDAIVMRVESVLPPAGSPLCVEMTFTDMTDGRTFLTMFNAEHAALCLRPGETHSVDNRGRG